MMRNLRVQTPRASRRAVSPRNHLGAAAGKKVLLVDVRTEGEMKVSILRGAVTQ